MAQITLSRGNIRLRRRSLIVLVHIRAFVRGVYRFISPVVNLVSDFRSFKGHYLAAAIAFYAFCRCFR